MSEKYCPLTKNICYSNCVFRSKTMEGCLIIDALVLYVNTNTMISVDLNKKNKIKELEEKTKKLEKDILIGTETQRALKVQSLIHSGKFDEAYDLLLERGD